METINSHSINLKLSLMKKQTKKKGKAVALSLAMATAISLPLVASAQEGLFQRGVSDETCSSAVNEKETSGMFGYRNTQTTGVINNQVFGQSVPIGSGVLILLAAGAGYAALKRKEDEK